ncbi:MAG: glycosyltransferase family 4 protein [Campylobacterales bacterium]|nr:glycosyltransferase family 4 protein [Campylobacterales bacterium]
MKKILLVGDGNHQFIRYLAKWLKKGNSKKILVDVLSLTEIKEEHCFDTIYYIKHDNLIGRIPKVNSLWLRLRFIRQLRSIQNNYDIINLHYITRIFSTILKIDFTAKIILTFWGSDFYRAAPKNKKIIKKIIDKSNLVTVTNPQMKEDIKAYYQDLTRKIETVRFGLEPLEKLRNSSASKEDSKKNLGIEKDKIIVCVGYNRSPAQHHIEIINSIESTLTKTEKDNIIVLLPLTYGNDFKYLEELKSFLRQVKIEFKTFLNFMTNEEVASLRQATDIFIQLQTTDQFSGSMQEHMYAKNIVITGSWLPYKVLEDSNVSFHKIAKVDDVGNKLQRCIANLDEEKQKVQKNDEIIYQLSGWPNVIDDWNKVYNLK